MNHFTEAPKDWKADDDLIINLGNGMTAIKKPYGFARLFLISNPQIVNADYTGFTSSNAGHGYAAAAKV